MSRRPALPSASDRTLSVQKAAIDVLAEARGALEMRGASHAARIHEFRRALKRLRALLRLMPPLQDAEDIRIEARDLARGLGSTRDKQAALDAVRDLRKRRSGSKLSQGSVKAIVKRLTQLKKSSRHAQISADTKLLLLTWIDSAVARVGMQPGNSPDFLHLVKGLTKSYRRARRAVPRKWKAASDQALHKLRQRVIICHSQLGLIEPLHSDLVTGWLDTAQKLRGRLGRHRDLVLLTRLADAGGPLAPWRERLQKDVRRRQRDHLAAAERNAIRLFDPSPRSFGKQLEALENRRRVRAARVDRNKDSSRHTVPTDT